MALEQSAGKRLRVSPYFLVLLLLRWSNDKRFSNQYGFFHMIATTTEIITIALKMFSDRCDHKETTLKRL